MWASAKSLVDNNSSQDQRHDLLVHWAHRGYAASL